jgi:transcription initiation factor TFIIIB Brf1 subunit/transcription initiation factor TFIIB
MFKITINNDVDLYYQLKINDKELSNNKNKDNLVENNDDNYDIEDYEKMIESIYNDNPVNNNDVDLYFDENKCETSDNKNMNGYYEKKINKKKKIYCESCNNDDLVEDTSHGILVCKSCGQVVANLMDCGAEWSNHNDDNKKDMNRCSHPISQLLPQSSTATTIAGSYSSRIKTLHGWGSMPYKERSLNDVFKIIQKKCFVGKIMKCIEDDAKIMYKNISDCKHITGKNKGKSIIIRGKNRMSVIAACVLFACRKKEKTRSPKEIAELFDLKYTEITKGCKIFQKLAKLKNMELKLNTTKPEHFILRFCEELKIKKEYSDQAKQISDNVQKIQIASVHTPMSLATGSIYLMIHLNNLAIQKKFIADKFNVSQVTIAKAFKKLEPFKNLLTNDEICNRLSIEIKKYQDNIIFADELKSKFVRFNIDTNKSLNKDSDIIYNILKKKNSRYILDNKLIIEHNIEIDNKMKQIDNEYIRLQITFIDELYDIYSKNNKNLLNIKKKSLIENYNKIIIENDTNIENIIN